MLETSSRIFTVLETSPGDFHGAGDFFWDFHSAGDFWDFHGAGDFFGGIFTVLETSLEGFSQYWRLLLEIFTVLETSSEYFFGRGSTCHLFSCVIM